MGMKTGALFSIVLLLSLTNAYSVDITEKEVELFTRAEYNRGFNNYGTISIAGGIELNNLIKFKSGFSLGLSLGDPDFNTFADIRYSPFKKIPLKFSLMYIYNGIPEYDTNTHALVPMILLSGKIAGLSIGSNFRFTSFFGEKPQFESILTFSGYLNFINNDKLSIGINAGNYDEFHAKNMGALSVSLNVLIRFGKNWTVINSLEYMQSGVDGFTATFYGVAWRGGAKFSW
ncbi:MAG: hypothetical protein FWB95_00815 [Treponema sp.]|nr:hypothetical protein [Treponema sp.]